MAKSCIVLEFEVQQSGASPPTPNPQYTATLRVSELNPPRDVETIQILNIDSLSISNMSALVRQHYGLEPLVEINWPFNAKGDLL